MASRLDEYIKAAGDSTQRARRLLLIIVSVAVLVIVAYANAIAGFRERRLQEVQHALEYVSAQREASRHVLRPETLGGLRKAHLVFDEEMWTRFKAKRPFASDSAVEAGLRADEAALQINLLKEASTVSFPLIGASVDVGDLWIVASLSLTLLQIALIYATARELADVSTTLVLARASNREDWQSAYDLLAMRQLFTVPPGTLDTGRRFAAVRESLWQFIPKLLFWLPPAAQVFGLVVGSRYVNRTLAAKPTDDVLGFGVEYWPELLTIVVSVVLTAFMIALSQRYDRVWHSHRPPVETTPKRSNSIAYEGVPALMREESP